MYALPIIIATALGFTVFALVGALLCRDRSIAGIVRRLRLDDALYARALLITGAPLGLLGWLAGRHSSVDIQQLGLVLTLVSTVIYIAVPLFVLRGVVAQRFAPKVVE